MNMRKQLRALMQEPGIIVVPGAYDGGTAMLVEGAGFPAVYMTGAGVSSTYGLPDYGLLSGGEMAARAGLMAGAVGIPLIADADTGYGNELNVTRTVRDYESRGVAALHIEDQVSPKRCGHLAGKEIVPRDEFLAKIRAAVAARRDPDFVIIARTDARAVAGMDEAVDRANAALDAGADMAFLEATRTVEEAASVTKLVRGPCLLNIVMGGVTPVYDLRMAQEMGYRAAILPVVILGTMVARAVEALEALSATSVHPPIPGDLTVQDLFGRFGAKRWDDLRTQFQQAFKESGEGLNRTTEVKP
jgi:2-methylisocitrate lyase-like PEP mutase family enzyme